MCRFVAVGPLQTLAHDELSLVEVDDAAVAVAFVGGRFYAFSDQCTHRSCSLSEGHLEGVSIVCPCHKSRFDVTSGAVLRGPATEPLTTYRTQESQDSLLVEA